MPHDADSGHEALVLVTLVTWGLFNNRRAGGASEVIAESGGQL
jgi:hypothetical protein